MANHLMVENKKLLRVSYEMMESIIEMYDVFVFARCVYNNLHVHKL
jgi:hypothetical protein